MHFLFFKKSSIPSSSLVSSAHSCCLRLQLHQSKDLSHWTASQLQSPDWVSSSQWDPHQQHTIAGEQESEFITSNPQNRQPVSLCVSFTFLLGSFSTRGRQYTGTGTFFMRVSSFSLACWGHRKTVMFTRPLSIRSLPHTTSHTQSSHHALVKIALIQGRQRKGKPRTANQSSRSKSVRGLQGRHMRNDRSQSTVQSANATERQRAANHDSSVSKMEEGLIRTKISCYTTLTE